MTSKVDHFASVVMRTVITVVAAFLIVVNIEGTAAVSGVTTFNDVCPHSHRRTFEYTDAFAHSLELSPTSLAQVWTLSVSSWSILAHHPDRFPAYEYPRQWHIRGRYERSLATLGWREVPGHDGRQQMQREGLLCGLCWP